jgi:putative aldouronate transport system substrate-binding protein
MMKLKKLVSLMLVGSMVLGMTACGGDTANTDKGTSETPAASDSEGKVSDALTPSETGGSKALQPFEETVTIKMGHGLDPNTVFDEGETVENSRFVQWLKNDLNIDVQYDWICASSDFGQKINLCIASNTIPDAVNVGQSQYLAMLKYDQIQPLTDVFEEYASDQLKQYVRSGGDALMDAISYNGEMYAIPAPEITAGGVNIMWIRQDWLDQLGLEVPRSVDEVIDVAQKFVEAKLGGDNTIGIIGPASGDQLVNIGGNRWGLDPIFGAYNSYPEYWLENDGKVTYGSVEPQTKEALAKLAEMYAAGAIDPEVFVRNDSLEPVTAGKAGIFFGPWWCGYTVDSVTLNGSQEWMAYMAPLAADGKFYSPMADPTKQYVCVRKGYEHPEAAIQIINYLIENEQSWVDNDMTQNNITASIYPLFNVYDNADEIEYSYEWLKKFNLGEVKKEDVDVTGRKLLRSDLDAIEVLKLDPKDDFSLEYWDLDHEMAASNIPRLVSIMIGERPLVEEGYVPIFNAYSGQTDTMAAKWANLQKLEEETFAKIILGQAPIDEFDNFVEKWYNEGGSEILEEITAAVNE